jgi:outer membrane biosynthesis protein TonB
MITRNNLLAEYPRIFQNSLPKALQQDEFDFIAENFDLIDDDEDIAKFVDTFIEKLNDVLEKQGKQGNPKKSEEKTEKAVITKKPSKQKSQKSPKSKPEPKPKKEKTPNPKREPKPPKQKNGNEVTELPIEATFLKAYYIAGGTEK